MNWLLFVADDDCTVPCRFHLSFFLELVDRHHNSTDGGQHTHSRKYRKIDCICVQLNMNVGVCASHQIQSKTVALLIFMFRFLLNNVRGKRVLFTFHIFTSQYIRSFSFFVSFIITLRLLHNIKRDMNAFKMKNMMKSWTIIFFCFWHESRVPNQSNDARGKC